MNQEECKYYRFGYSGCNFLSVNRSVYTQSELLPDGVIREIICDKDDKWMKVRERKEENEKEINKRTALRLLSGSPTLVLTQLVVT